ncbi:hypothetical protein GW924_03965 [Candidatus Pacearchaeota archaeon]|nr:hypothetical protein [Candidatus Pacearchaeota archaeon]
MMKDRERWLILLWLVVADALLFLLRKTGFFIGNVLLSPQDTGFTAYFWIIVIGLCLTLIFVSFLIVRNSIRGKKELLEKDAAEEN